MSNDVTARVESFLADIKSIGIARQQHGMAFSAIDDAMLSAAFAANTPGIGYWSLWPEVDAGKPTYIEFGIYNTTNQYWHVSVQRPDQVSLELRLAVVDGVC